MVDGIQIRSFWVYMVRTCKINWITRKVPNRLPKVGWWRRVPIYKYTRSLPNVQEGNPSPKKDIYWVTKSIPVLRRSCLIGWVPWGELYFSLTLRVKGPVHYFVHTSQTCWSIIKVTRMIGVTRPDHPACLPWDVWVNLSKYLWDVEWTGFQERNHNNLDFRWKNPPSIWKWKKLTVSGRIREPRKTKTVSYFPLYEVITFP